MFDDMTLELPASISGLFGSRKKKKTRCIGVDIGSSSIKIVELEKKGGDKIVLKNYAMSNVNRKGLIKPGSAKIISSEVGRIVGAVLNDAEIKTKDINVAIPSFASLITTIELPPVSEKEIDQIIQIEAPKYIPIPLEEVIYGWEIVDSSFNEEDNIKLSKTTGGSMMKVVLVSIMKSISQEYEKVFSASDLNIDSLEVDTFALKRALVGEKSKSCLIVDVGSNIANISVVVNESIVVNRSIDVGGDRITELLSQALGVNEERAEKIKVNQGLEIDSQDIKKQVLFPLLKNITDEINRTVGVFNENYPNLEVGSLILVGGLSQMKGFSEFVSKETNIKVVAGNPWAKISYPQKLENSLFSLNPYFGTAIGLALRGLED